MTKRPRRVTWRSGTTRVRGLTREAFPALRAFLRGYLHQDFEAVHGSLRAAADAFRADASPAERDQLVQELVSLTASGGGPVPTLRQFIRRTGWRLDAEVEGRDAWSCCDARAMR